MLHSKHFFCFSDTWDMSLEGPDHSLKIYKSDQQYKYLLVHQVSVNTRQFINQTKLEHFLRNLFCFHFLFVARLPFQQIRKNLSLLFASNPTYMLYY
jgi:hypothetical protein